MKNKILNQIPTLIITIGLVVVAVIVGSEIQAIKRENKILKFELTNFVFQKNKIVIDKIKETEQKVIEIAKNDSLTLIKIKKINQKFYSIKRKLKKIDNEKIKNDSTIVSYPPNANRNWFNSRFPKHNRLSDTTNTLTGKSSKDR